VYNLFVPIEIAGGDTSFVEHVWITGPDSFFAFNCSFKPGRVSVDPHYDLFRRMEPGEIPPTISSVLGDHRSLLVLPSRAEPDARSSYDSIIKQLNRTGEGIIKADTTVTIADLKQKSLLVLGGKTENAIFDIMPLPAAVELDKDGFTIAGSHYGNPGHSAYITFKNPYNPSKSVCVITGMTADAVEKSGYKIIHYGKYSFVTFENGNRISAGILPVEDNPLVYEID